MNNYTNEKELENQESYGDNASVGVDVQEFPPRSEAHRRIDKRKTRVQKKKKIKIPLVRILLFLFLFLVAAMVTYPVWIQRL